MTPFTREPLMKNVALIPWSASTSSTFGVVAGLGPSSNVSATRLANPERSGTTTPLHPPESSLPSSVCSKASSKPAVAMVS